MLRHYDRMGVVSPSGAPPAATGATPRGQLGSAGVAQHDIAIWVAPRLKSIAGLDPWPRASGFRQESAVVRPGVVWIAWPTGDVGLQWGCTVHFVEGSAHA